MSRNDWQINKVYEGPRSHGAVSSTQGHSYVRGIMRVHPNLSFGAVPGALRTLPGEFVEALV